MGYTRGQACGRTQKKHFQLEHNFWISQRLVKQFNVLAKCNSLYDCLVLLFIRKLKLELNFQTDSIPFKVFVYSHLFSMLEIKISVLAYLIFRFVILYLLIIMTVS